LKFLLDSCIARFVRDVLLQAGHEVDWCIDWPADPGDQTILSHAYETRSILVTLDKDFGELAIVRKLPHNGIIRLAGLSVMQQALAPA
jgi:predicted nuclease of predicted toxin-antitoxin system